MRGGWRASAALCLGLALLAAGCSGRERSNPFDPGNPETRGHPADFRAAAANGEVTLSWAWLANAGLAGYRLWRRGPGDADFVALGELGPDSTSYEDHGLTNDSSYTYRLAFVLTTGRVGPPAETLARPGPGAAWVADAGADQIVRLTPDARERVLALPGLDNPTEVEIEPVARRVWGSSRTTGYVAVWLADGSLVGADGSFSAPGAVSPIAGSTDAWVAEERSGLVTRWGPGASATTRIPTGGLPSDLDPVPGTEGVWVADRAGRRLLQVGPTGLVSAIDLPGRPWRLAADLDNGDIWVSYLEDGAVERRSPAGAFLARADGLARPFALAIDPLRQRIWVTLADGGAAIALDRQGQVVTRIAGLERPRGVAVDQRTGEVWITTLGARDGDGSVLLFSSTGAPLSGRHGFQRPVDVAVVPNLGSPR